jgi:hypothetical protein
MRGTWRGGNLYAEFGHYLLSKKPFEQDFPAAAYPKDRRR